ncbi:calcium-binding protein [Nocardioides humilatus]|uniref:Calcium-binding protein n=1 Tax=Nocardioides humilatus TaxID=2607660 RepID=A0A5B1LLW2_9ACTN|nr:calcium-binding protein [Nocardioides humilatus]KAA1421523.1 calcium-binding protein [Nocardioides humilatus]
MTPRRPLVGTCLASVVMAAALAVVVLPDGADARPTRAERQERIVRPATLKRTDDGYYFGAWGQNSKVTVTLVEDGLKFRDARTARWELLARVCTNVPVRRGVAAICPVPPGVSVANPLTIDFEMRLGDDTVTTSALPAEFQASVLADAGRDVIRTGPGDDFINGAFDHDEIWAGDGNDWVRSGEGSDLVFGEGGEDRLVGGEVGDVLHGGDGNDSVEGGPGDDTMYGDAGADTLKCGPGSDSADVDPADEHRFDCEHVAP